MFAAKKILPKLAAFNTFGVWQAMYFFAQNLAGGTLCISC
jgi:hypothetical protein